MKYVCLVHVDGSAMGAMSAAEGAKLTDQTIEFDWKYRRSGHLILGQPLQSPETAVVIRSRKGKISRTDGPYMGTKEALGGFFIIEARDLEEAVKIASESLMAQMGSIEVRPALEQTHSRTGEGRPKL